LSVANRKLVADHLVEVTCRQVPHASEVPSYASIAWRDVPHHQTPLIPNAIVFVAIA